MTPDQYRSEIVRLQATVDRKDDQMAELQAVIETERREVDRLRRELEIAFEVAREIGDERNELARKLGEEVAENQRLRGLLRKAGVVGFEKGGGI